MKWVGMRIRELALCVATAAFVLALGSGSASAQNRQPEAVENTRPQSLDIEVSFYGFYFLDGVEVTESELREGLRAAGTSDRKPEVVVSVDIQRHWKEVGTIASMVQEFGLPKVLLKARMRVARPPAPAVTPKPVNITVKEGGVLLIDGEVVSQSDLSSRLAAIASMQPQPQVEIRGDASLKFGEVAFVIAAVQRAGLRRVGIIGGT